MTLRYSATSRDMTLQSENKRVSKPKIKFNITNEEDSMDRVFGDYSGMSEEEIEREKTRLRGDTISSKEKEKSELRHEELVRLINRLSEERGKFEVTQRQFEDDCRSFQYECISLDKEKERVKVDCENFENREDKCWAE